MTCFPELPLTTKRRKKEVLVEPKLNLGVKPVNAGDEEGGRTDEDFERISNQTPMTCVYQCHFLLNKHFPLAT